MRRRGPAGHTEGESSAKMAVQIDDAFISLRYPNDIVGNIQVSWLDPKKLREIVVVGDKQMVVWDELAPAGPISIYDKGIVKEQHYDTFGQFQLLAREGDITIPRVSHTEPLKVELTTFVASALAASRSRSVGAPSFDASSLSGIDQGLDVVRVLEAGQRSLESGGAAVALGEA